MSLVADSDDLSQAMSAYEPAYQESFADHTLALLGLQRASELRDDLLFLQEYYAWMTHSGSHWPQTFFDWFGGAASSDRASMSPQSDLYKTDEFQKVRALIEARTPARPERLNHAYFQAERPVDLIVETVEALWDPIAADDNWAPLQAHLDWIEQARVAYDWPDVAVPIQRNT
ncbi:MAG: hypothetical protein Hens2KO_15630 [Henriciella sp.]